MDTEMPPPPPTAVRRPAKQQRTLPPVPREPPATAAAPASAAEAANQPAVAAAAAATPSPVATSATSPSQSIAASTAAAAAPLPAGSIYTLPLWSAAPLHPFSLSVIKDGRELEEIPLTVRSHFLLGRAGDLCDIVLEHASVSRRHAVLQFHESGSLWLYDLGAAHGTFVNRARIAPREFVELRVGDQLRFGASTRTYVVEGPDEFRPQEVDKQRIAQRQAALQQQQAAAHERQRQAGLDEKKRLRANGGVDAGADEDSGASWGMGGEDAVDSDEEREGSGGVGGGDGGGLNVNSDGSLALPTKLTTTQQKLVEKLSKRRDKIQNLTTEVEVLRSKDIRQGGLSAGQENQIAKNEERLRLMVQEVEEMEAQLAESVARVAADREKQRAHEQGREAASVAATTAAAGKKRRRGADSDDDDDDGAGGDSDDDFFDRTKAPPKAKSAPGGSGSASAGSAGGASQFLSTLTPLSALHTPEEITAELRRIEQKRDQMRHTLQEVAVLEAKEKRVHASSASSAAAPAGDTLDSFMSGLAHSHLSARKASLKEGLAALQTHHIKLQRLVEQRKGEARTKRYLEGDRDAFKVEQTGEAAAPTATKAATPVSGPVPAPAPAPLSAVTESAQPSPAGAVAAAPAPVVAPQPQPQAAPRPAPSAAPAAPSTADVLARMKKKQEAQARKLREQEQAEERAEALEKERKESAAIVAASVAAATPRTSGGAPALPAASSTPQDRYALLAQQLEAARGHKNYSSVPEDHAARAAKARAMATAASIASDAIADRGAPSAGTGRGAAANAAAVPRSVGPYAPHVESAALQQAQNAETVEWTPPVASAAAGQDKLRAKFAGRY